MTWLSHTVGKRIFFDGLQCSHALDMLFTYPEFLAIYSSKYIGQYNEILDQSDEWLALPDFYVPVSSGGGKWRQSSQSV